MRSVRKIVVFAPHPDDEAIGCGGAIATHVERGDDVHVAFLTSGEAGQPKPGVTDFGAVREGEARAAAAILGYSTMFFWRARDGALRVDRDVIGRAAALIEAAAVVYVTNPWEMHQDHRAAARLVRRAAGLLATPPRLLAYEVWTPLHQIDEIIDIGSHLKTKLAAIRAHASQDELVDFAAAAEGLARYRGELFLWPEGEYAEVFAEISPLPPPGSRVNE